jgi:hypothetical protein
VPRVLKDKNRKSVVASRRRRGSAHNGSGDRRRSGWRDARTKAKESGSHAVQDPPVGASFHVRWVSGDGLRCRRAHRN